jgi:hypothetical protein
VKWAKSGNRRAEEDQRQAVAGGYTFWERLLRRRHLRRRSEPEQQAPLEPNPKALFWGAVIFFVIFLSMVTIVLRGVVRIAV